MIVGRTEPRLWTPPLRELTPETSYGFDVIEFARVVLGHPLDPWQGWVVIHAGELLPDGRPRFRKVLVLVSRQNGKTELLVVLTLYWLFVDRVAMVLGTSTKLDYAAESWRKACRLARRVPDLNEEIPAKGGIRKANGEQVLWRADADEEWAEEGSRYKIAASNEEGGRSLTIDRLVLDELRQHHDYSAHDASVPATNAVPDAQIWALSNAGSDKSVVLNDWRDSALTFIETAEGDERLGLFEYSAPDGSSPVDLDALAQANPNLGRRIDADALLAAAVEADGRVRIDVVKAWAGATATRDLRAELRPLVARVKPRKFGWFPTGPAAAITADLATGEGWPPAGVELEEIRKDLPAVCMGFAELVKNGQVLHSDDPLINAQVTPAEKVYRGDAWVFGRKGAGHVNVVYAASGATHLARTLPPPNPPAKPVILRGRRPSDTPDGKISGTDTKDR